MVMEICATVLCICDSHIGHLEQASGGVFLIDGLNDASEGLTELQRGG